MSQNPQAMNSQARHSIANNNQSTGAQPAIDPQALYRQLAQLSPEQRALFEQKLAQRGVELPTQAITISPRQSPGTAEDKLPLSFAQQRLWFIQQLDPNATNYNVASVFKLTGPLNIELLSRALNGIIERHETFRTTFELSPENQPIQVIHPHQVMELPLEDLRGVQAQSAQQIRVQDCIETLTQEPFDLQQPLLRLALLQTGDREHLLVLATHHIIADRWSVMVFLRELTLLYRSRLQGKPSPLSALPIQYADWAIWQRQQLQGQSLKEQQGYWLEQLGGELPWLDLPTDRPYPPVPSYEGAQYPVAFSPELSAQLQSLSRGQGTTLFTTLLAGMTVLLHRYTDQDDILIGSDIANRDRAETEGLIGLLVNTLVLRSNLADNPRFSQLLSQVRETVLGAFAHQSLPFEKLVELLNPERHLSQMTPLFQVKLDLQQAQVKPLALDGLSLERYPLEERQAKYELRFNLQETEAGITGQVEYSTDLFDQPTIARLVQSFETLLTSIVANPEQHLSDLELLGPGERQKILRDWNQTQSDAERSDTWADICIHQLFERQVAKTPQALAVVEGECQLTYAALGQQSNQLSQHLKNLGVVSGMRVGVCTQRSVEMVVALLAILKLGAAYVPLDPNYPAARAQFILEDAQVAALLTQGAGLDAVREGLDKSITIVALEDVQLSVESPEIAQADVAPELSPPSETTSSPVTAEDLAYIIYTSGSTGKPKGVAIAHHNTVSMLHWAQQQFDREVLQAVLASTSICFDLSVFELFLPLSCGGSVVLADNALALSEIQHPVTLINTVPSAMAQLLQQKSLPESLHSINLAGEAFPPQLLKQLQQLPQSPRIFNLYGPSEDTTYSTCAAVHDIKLGEGEHRVPIGRPIANTQAYVLDRWQNPLPVGVAGELYLGGAGVAQGYWNRPALTAERFVANPFGEEQSQASQRLYRTGDRVRYRPDGNLEFLGRLDYQLKLRGFRIETGEIEAVLCQHPQVQEAVVLAQTAESHAEFRAEFRAESNGDTQLVAYFVAADFEADSTAITTLKAHLSQQLPGYMLPNRWVALAQFPRLPNGKLNRAALPQLDDQRPQLATAYQAPSSEPEVALAKIWRQTLGLEQVGIHDNFFELGGHSLLAVQLMGETQTVLGQKIPLRQLFQTPTVAGLAAYLEQHQSEPNLATTEAIDLSPDPDARHQPFPLTDIQQAYLLGRSQAFELGNVSTHGYREIEVQGLTVTQVEQALNQLIQRHDMLRVVTTPDGQQQTLAEVPSYEIVSHDLRALTPEAVVAKQLALRDRLSHQIFATDRWPLFAIEAARLKDPSTGQEKTCFYVSFDVLIGDAWSFQLLGWQMGQQLLGHPLKPASLSLTFRDYVLAEQHFQQTEAYAQAWDYWRSRLPNLPAAPELPLIQAPSAIEKPQFVRRGDRLKATDWRCLKQRAQQFGLTASGLLLAAFSEVLALWSRSPRFTLNLTLFNRQPLHPEVNHIIGDFTASMFLAVDYGAEQDADPGQDPNGFITRARRLQAQLWQDLDHRQVSGVKVLRELARLQQRPLSALMPVVFTSTLNQAQPKVSERPWQTEMTYSVSQTSQVYLDHQVSEVEGELVFNWDSIDALFPPGLLDEMFATYQRLLEQLVQNEALWQKPVRAQLMPAQPAIAKANATQVDLFDPARPEPLLHSRFFDQAQRQPLCIAVIDGDQKLSYGELRDRVLVLANQLRSLNVQPNQLVAVSLKKGWEQVVAVLAILTAGAAYVPIDPALPEARRGQLLEATEATILLTQPELEATLSWPEAVHRIAISEASLAITEPSNHGELIGLIPLQQPSDLAYVIYTSGSTGMPKGVMIDHRGAMNTLLDMNQRLELSPADRVLALSSLSFDLSVYDLFAPLAVGAAIVMPQPDSERDPAHWLKLIQQHQVTIWNSVPALMQLLMTEVVNQQGQTAVSPTSLRHVLLSGDWIPLTLPSQIRQHCPQAQVLSLGGATEASIWSIHYPIDQVSPDWSSIPYGRALNNQQWHVLNENFEPCPAWVTGQLYISGRGLALGYWNNPDKTGASFIVHPQTRERLYKTGDLGRYLPDGNIEFLGREDFQVKLNGYRVELGEIEAVLQQHPAIETAVVTTVGESNGQQQLAAYLVAIDDSKSLNQTANLGGAEAAPNRLSNALARLDSKLQREGLRQFEPDQPQLALPLPETEYPQPFIQRQSYRQFLSEPVAIATLSQLLSQLRSIQLQNSPLPKYRYASAGSLYPVQTYIQIQPNRIADAEAGFYYYDPENHRLIKLDSIAEGIDNSVIYQANQDLAAKAAFSIFLVAELAVITPLYGEKARDFCLLEAGYMSQLLMETAPDYELGLCPMGGLDAARLQQTLGLGDSQELLHSLCGGAIAPAWTEQWQVLNPPNKAGSLTDRLRDFAEEHLPSYMVPTHFQWLQELPLSANGKVNRQALPAIALATANAYVAPRNPLEQDIAAVWQSVVEAEQVGIHDNFFDVGGNSLSAMQAISQLRQAFQLDLSIRSFFTAPTVAEQAEMIAQKLTEVDSEPSAQPLDRAEAIPRLARSSGASAMDEPLPPSSPDSTEPTAESGVDLDALSESEMDGLLQQLLTEQEVSS